jgi:hypothetical protein
MPPELQGKIPAELLEYGKRHRERLEVQYHVYRLRELRDEVMELDPKGIKAGESVNPLACLVTWQLDKMRHLPCCLAGGWGWFWPYRKYFE